jgi:hypothetical protein
MKKHPPDDKKGAGSMFQCLHKCNRGTKKLLNDKKSEAIA